MAHTTREFDALYQNYHSLVYQRLYYLLGEREAARELTQEVFLKLHRSPPHDHSGLGGWLLRVAANLGYNYLRGEARRRRREEGQYREEADVIPLEEAVIRDQEAKRVHRCLAQLEPRDRVCLLLKNAGHSYTEIAAVIEAEKSSVGTILARARQRFRELYHELEGREDHVSGRRRSASLS